MVHKDMEKKHAHNRMTSYDVANERNNANSKRH